MSRTRKGNSRFDALRAKPPLYWVTLIAFFSLVGSAAYQSAVHAIASIAWQQSPDLALRLMPDHPLALSLNADHQFFASQSSSSLKKVEEMAKQSLRKQPLNPVSVRLIAYVADARGEAKMAQKTMLLAQKISRRDFGTQLWLIENAVARGNKNKALYHYDVAMRTVPSSYQVLFPTLTRALSDPDVRRGLVPYVSQAPEWLPRFISHATNTSDDLVDLADMLVRGGPLPEREDYRILSNSLLALLAAESEFSEFQEFYLSLPDSTTGTLRSAAFDKGNVNTRYPAAGWQIANNPGISGTFSLPDRAGQYSLSAFAGSGERGELMRKHLFLPRGNYQFIANYHATEEVADAEIRWDLHCMVATGSNSEWSKSMPVRKGKSATVQDFNLKPDCPNQMLVLQLAGGSGQLGAEFIVRSLRIVRR